MSHVLLPRITPRHYAYMATVVHGFLTKALETKTYNLKDIPKGVLAGVVDFFDEALKAVSFRGLLHNDICYICTQIIIAKHGKLVEEKIVYDLMRYRSFFTQARDWNHQVLDNHIASLRELHAFFTTLLNLANSDDSWRNRDDDDD